MPSETLNKVCASGLRAVTLCDQMIRAQDADILVAGGMESMSNIPYAVPAGRWGARMGDGELRDLMVYDWTTMPMTFPSTSSPETPARCSASFITMPPSSAAFTSFNTPPNLPNGVLAVYLLNEVKP